MGLCNIGSVFWQKGAMIAFRAISRTHPMFNDVHGLWGRGPIFVASSASLGAPHFVQSRSHFTPRPLGHEPPVLDPIEADTVKADEDAQLLEIEQVNSEGSEGGNIEGVEGCSNEGSERGNSEGMEGHSDKGVEGINNEGVEACGSEGMEGGSYKGAALRNKGTTSQVKYIA